MYYSAAPIGGRREPELDRSGAFGYDETVEEYGSTISYSLF